MTITIAIIILTSYTVTMCAVNRKIPASLSQTVFALPLSGRWLWSVVIVAVAFLTIPTMMNQCSESSQFLAFIACASLMMVGVCPLVHQIEELPYRIHMVMAYTSGISSQVCVAVNEPKLLLVWMAWIVFYLIMKATGTEWTSAKFWAEMTCFVVIFLYIS